MKLQVKRTHEFKLPTGVLDAALADDGTVIAGCMDGVYQSDLAGASELLDVHSSYVSSVRLLPDQQTVISAGYDGNLHWIDRHSKTRRRLVDAHRFWSWDMAVSADGQRVVSVTGQYRAGGYRYEPAAETEPSVRILAADSGETLHSLPHVPSVQAAGFSPDGRFVAAGNLMGEVRVWDTSSGQQVASWTTDAFTSWGIIKSHCYLGGVFALEFTPDGKEILLAGMGPMRDPMAGNGKQLWQKWSWQQEPQLVDQTHKGENGEGLMEALAVHPQHDVFVMGGRLRGGDWNAALFELSSGRRLATLKTGYRITQAQFTADGRQMLLVGAQGQPKVNKHKADGDFGRVEMYAVSIA